MAVASLADHAYSHCQAVVDDPAASEAAIAAVRRGGRSRSSVLAFARYHALQRAAAADTTDDGAGDRVTGSPVPDELTDLAPVLAALRPPVERAVVDLGYRHGLDRSALGRSLGLSPVAAGLRLNAVAEAWRAELDPVLLAWLGPGECDGLAEVLAAAGPFATVGDLLAVGPVVAAHVDGCELCQDRMRAMVSVADMVGQRPLEAAPENVAIVARRNRFRPPAGPPPSIDPQSRRRWPRVAVAAAAVVALVGIVLSAAAVAQRPTSRDRRKDRIAALTKVAPAGTSLQLSPAVVRAAAGALLLRNVANTAVEWRAAAGATWLAISPAAGRLVPGEVVELATVVQTAAPEGQLRTSVTITGNDGSAAGAVVETTVEHAPTIAATIEGCRVNVDAEDESAVASALVHWRPASPPGQERSVSMTNGPRAGTYLGDVSPGSRTWWVTAVDDRGNRAITPEQPVANC
jgi:hypothetical protein